MQYYFFLFIYLALTLSALGQISFNNIYDSDVREFNREIHVRENGNLIIQGGGGTETGGISGRLIREIDTNGNLLWIDHIPHDSIPTYSNWTHASVLVSDSLLIFVAPATLYRDGYDPTNMPYYLRYNVNQQSVEHIAFFDMLTGTAPYSVVLHNDGFLYATGERDYIDEDPIVSDQFIMKLAINGDLLWIKYIDYADWDICWEIESYGDNLITFELGNPFGSDAFGMLSIIDTSGQIINNKQLQWLDSTGEIEILNESIFLYAASDIFSDDKPNYILAEFDESLEIVWDTLIYQTSQYEIEFRRIEIINNEQLIVIGNIKDAQQYTNGEVWSYAASWTLDGQNNWEHLYKYDSSFVHHLDDIEMVENGDLVFLGTVFERQPWPEPSNQMLWLFKTDSQGCGEVVDTCLQTLEEYFSLHITVGFAENDFELNNHLQILGNPFNQQLVYRFNGIVAGDKTIQISNINGQLLMQTTLKANETFNTQAWASSIYIFQVIEGDKVLSTVKLVKQ